MGPALHLQDISDMPRTSWQPLVQRPICLAFTLTLRAASAIQVASPTAENVVRAVLKPAGSLLVA